MGNPAFTYKKQGGLDGGSEVGGERGLEMRSSVQCAEHPDTLITMQTLAQMYKFGSRNDEAIELTKDVGKRSTKILGADHPHTLEAAKWLSTWTGL